ncbi:hypothetical protein ABZP36_032480 [Zizania latifolia]
MENWRSPEARTDHPDPSKKDALNHIFKATLDLLVADKEQVAAESKKQVDADADDMDGFDADEDDEVESDKEMGLDDEEAEVNRARQGRGGRWWRSGSQSTRPASNHEHGAIELRVVMAWLRRRGGTAASSHGSCERIHW